MEKTFTQTHTKIAKGLAMILMLFDHLFWMDNGSYISVCPKIFGGGMTLEWAIGSIGNICVAMFLMLSGYGMFCTVQKKEKYSLRDSLIRIRNIWVQYALITIVFIVLDLLFGKITWDPLKIVLNILALDYSYNAYAWFMITYIVIMFVFPLWYRFARRYGWVWQILCVCAVKIGITGIYQIISRYVQIPSIPYKVLIEPFMFLPAFLIGYICAEYHIFEIVYEKIFCRKGQKALLSVLLLGIFLFIYQFQLTLLDAVTAPIICFLVSYLFYHTMAGKVLEFIGAHSTGMWLIHYPIMILLLNRVVYFPKISVLILIWLIILLIPMCYVSEFINRNVLKWMRRKK